MITIGSSGLAAGGGEDGDGEGVGVGGDTKLPVFGVSERGRLVGRKGGMGCASLSPGTRTVRPATSIRSRSAPELVPSRMTLPAAKPAQTTSTAAATEAATRVEVPTLLRLTSTIDPSPRWDYSPRGR